jgi:hypothetical protein
MAAVVSLAILGAFIGVVLIGRSPSSSFLSGPPEASPGRGVETVGPHNAGPPSIHWTRVAMDAPDLGSIIDFSVARADTGLIAAGTTLDTSHHHNDADSEVHHLEAIVWTSPDGGSWHRVDRQPGFEHATLSSVEVSGGQTLAIGSAVGEGGRHSARIWRSTDGASWSIVSPTGLPSGVTLGTLTALGDGFLLAASEPAGGYITPASLWRSPDGSAWERIPVGAGESVLAWSVFALGDGLVAIGQRSLDSADPVPVLIRSVDGAEWDRVQLAGHGFGPDLVGIDDIAAGGPGSIAAGRVVDGVSPQDPAATRLGPPTDGAIWTSPDLATWTRVEPGRALFGGTDDQDIRIIEAVDGGYVALGTSGGHGRGWVSADGAAWQLIADLDALADASLRDAITVGGDLVVVGIGTRGEPVVWLGQAPPMRPAGSAPRR